jgi:hypothetical protein
MCSLFVVLSFLLSITALLYILRNIVNLPVTITMLEVILTALVQLSQVTTEKVGLPSLAHLSKVVNFVQEIFYTPNQIPTLLLIVFNHFKLSMF